MCLQFSHMNCYQETIPLSCNERKKMGTENRSVREQVHKCKNLLVLAHYIILDVNALFLLFPSFQNGYDIPYGYILYQGKD